MDVAAAVAALDAAALERLLADACTQPQELQLVENLAAALPQAAASELQRLLPDVVRAVKSLSRLAVKCVAATAGDTQNAAKLVALDGKLLPLLRVLHALVGRLRARELRESVCDAEQLRRWLPFVLTACCSLEAAELPGADLMQSVALAAETLDACVQLAQADGRAALLATYVAQIVALCSQDVSKEQWVAAASVNKRVMLYVVLQVPFPHLGGDLLGRLLALTFPLVDDLTDATQLVGARLLRHIVRNVTPTELRWYSDVLLEVLHTAMVSRKPATLDVLLDCLVESLDKVSPPGELKHYDRFTPRMLSDTSLCSDVAVRVVFVRHLRALVVRQGAPHSLNVIRYLQPLLKVLIAGFESVNVSLLEETLETLRATILAAWPRVAPHTEQILVGVLRAVAFCELFESGADFTPSPKEKDQLLALCEDNIDLLHQVNAENPVVSDMLATVGNQSPKLSPFCDRMQLKWTPR
ncbi:Armadillo-type fold [Phytophthora cinnamomi]|uniref:Armadillo-type fold n=1 Tax=Phytophthora cinnamomi TaxID=4785 RepID=UPI00355ABC45|nr:Armadillo-type fold [Phytophthora cinnamomi]